MSDFNDPDLDINIDLNMDQSKTESAHKQLLAIESIWNRLSSLPILDLNNKVKLGKITQESSQQFGVFHSSGFYSAAEKGADKEKEALNKLSYSWDSLYSQEIKLLQNKEKQEKTLNLLSNSVSEKMKSIPASSTGKYHPLFAQEEGGLVRHSKAVAQTAYGLAGLLNVPGSKDRFVVAGLMHDMWKLGPEGKSQFTDPKHGALAADALAQAGLDEEAALAGPHMGNFFKGPYKNAPKISSFDQRLLNNADWLMSRTYAQDFVKWEKDTGNIESIDVEGVRKEAIRRKEAKVSKEGLLIPLIEEQEKLAQSAKKHENSWHSVKATAGQFLDILKTIGGLGLAALTIGIKETTAGAAQVNAGLGMFTGTTNENLLDNSLREAKAGISQGSINKAVISLASKRGQFNLTGAGDLLPMAMAGTIESLMLSKKPMQEVYGQIVDMFTKQLASTKDQTQRDKLLALVNTNLGPEAAALVNAQAGLGQNWEQLGARTSPATGFLDWSKQVMEINAQMQTSLNGIKDTWKGLFVEFMSLFGNPFLSWIDTVFRSLGKDVNAVMNSRKAEDTYLGLYNNLGTVQKNKMMRGSLLGTFDKRVSSVGAAFSAEIQAAGKLSITDVNEVRRREGLEPFSALDFRTGANKAYTDKLKLEAARKIAEKYGVAVTPEDSYYSILRKAEEAGRNSIETKVIGKEIPGFNSIPMTTAKNWAMFNTPENRKRFPQATRTMEQFPDLLNTTRLADPFDSTIQGVMDALSTGTMTEAQIMPILEHYLNTVESKKRDADKTSMSVAPAINMNFSLPDGSNPTAVKVGILEAAREVPKIIEDSYQTLYAGGYG